MPELTPEQKEHFKMAHRANMRIEETWSLFCMYLSQDKDPAEALRRARDAVELWAVWMDENEVEPPEIAQPNFGQELVDSMGKMFEKLPESLRPRIRAEFASSVAMPEVDAEFIPTPDERTSHPNEQPTSIQKQD